MENRVGLINPRADTSYQYMTFIKKVSVPHLCYDRDHLWPQQVNIILLWLFSSIRYVASEMLLVGEGHINREWSLRCSSAWFLIHICLNADSQKHEENGHFADFIKDLPPGFQPGVFVVFDIITLQQSADININASLLCVWGCDLLFSLAEELHWAFALIGEWHLEPNKGASVKYARLK